MSVRKSLEKIEPLTEVDQETLISKYPLIKLSFNFFANILLFNQIFWAPQKLFALHENLQNFKSNIVDPADDHLENIYFKFTQKKELLEESKIANNFRGAN